MPLDDAYIHFQYSRQLANGEPFVYNPGESATSGATSLLYPFLLAPGHLLGFTGLSLGYWALALGLVALITGAMLVYALCLSWPNTSPIIAALIAFTYITNGPIVWHHFSGMETGLMITLTLGTLYGFTSRQGWLFIAFATLLAITRPEGSIMTLIAVTVYLLRHCLEKQPHSTPTQLPVIALAVPILAIGLQPLINLLVTGSASAAGSQAKSILGIVPFDPNNVIQRITDNALMMWQEFATGTDGTYTPIILVVLAVAGIVISLRYREIRYSTLLIILWLLAVSTAISTLDTAFWHFKRYQMPLIALTFPLAGWAISWIGQHIPAVNLRYLVFGVLGLAIVGFNGTTWAEFQRLYTVNINNIAAQPLPMAQWLATNTPEDAVVAVHDVGMMRYIGARHTVDMVGLTTTGAADYWRNGPGSVAEFLIMHEPRPDYMAAYTTARGLNYLTETPLYGELLTGFSAEYDPADNVALGAEFQGIYRVDWETLAPSEDPLPRQPTAQQLAVGSEVIATIDVANLQSEQIYQYEWANTGPVSGFVTEVYEWPYIDCTDTNCTTTDAGRLINQREAFTIQVARCSDLVLVSRVHPAHAGTIDIHVNGEWIDTQWIPRIPGTWLEIPTYISQQHCSETMQIEIKPTFADGFYMPYQHWLIPTAEPNTDTPDPLATFQNGAIQITHVETQYADGTFTAEINWQQGDTPAVGDYKIFFHVYDDIDAPPIAQRDFYPGKGTLPPGNWFPGTIQDRVTVQLGDIEAGTYAIALGFYEATTGERLHPVTMTANWDADENGNRLFLDSLEILEDG